METANISAMADYRVNLDVYNGPLDLLLYLIRRDEVDIYDIPIASITEQYLQYLELLKRLDPDLAGEFLVTAATLVEIKTRMLLPAPPPEEAEDNALDIDPRAELVRQLLQYKAFKDAAGDLQQAKELQGQKYSRPGSCELGDKKELDIDDVQVWDLFDAFSNVLQAIGAETNQHEVIYDDTPLELHATDIIDRLGREGPMTFARVFEGRTIRTEIVGLFLAMLELIRQRRILVRQKGNFVDIWIELNPDPPSSDNDQQTFVKDSDPSNQQSAAEPPTGNAEGQYIPEVKSNGDGRAQDS